MGERAKIILNEYSARDLLRKTTIDVDKFYTPDLKLLIQEAQKEIKQLQLENEKLKSCYCNRTDCSGRIKNSKNYDSLQEKVNRAIEYIEVQDNFVDYKDYQNNCIGELYDLLQILGDE